MEPYFVQQPDDVRGPGIYPYERTTFQEILALPKQQVNCPASVQQLPSYYDSMTGLTMDDYIFANWVERQYMQTVVLRVRQVESSERKLEKGGTKGVTNVMLKGARLSEVAMSAWEPNDR